MVYCDIDGNELKIGDKAEIALGMPYFPKGMKCKIYSFGKDGQPIIERQMGGMELSYPCHKLRKIMKDKFSEEFNSDSVVKLWNLRDNEPDLKDKPMGTIKLIESKMKYLNIESLKDFCDFEKGIYYLMAIARKKDNEDLTNSTEIVMRRTVNNELQLERSFEELKGLIELDPKHKYKLYINFNPRDVKKAYLNLKNIMAEWDYNLMNNPNIYNKILNVDREWCSCLARSPCKKTYFMLDLDDKDSKYALMLLLGHYQIKKTWSIETQNGHHILFKPCDTRKLMEEIKNAGIDCELKRDDLLCIGYPNVYK